MIGLPKQILQPPIAVLCALLVSASGCGKSGDEARPAPPASVTAPVAAAPQPPATARTQFELGNTRYLFVLDQHDDKDLLALLQRADEIARTSLQHFGDLDIALVIHGPSVQLFTQSAYLEHRELIDLAARLDAFGVIDLKICETSLREAGIADADIPSFIERVPYAPDEMIRLTRNGYINL
ncbi:MAG: DsrE family protein [Gammaproteobacteria bacterium]|nr:DsrE family protein [Gammaproteobacteria bacterium]